MKKRILGVLLCLCMVCALLHAAALAVEGETVTTLGYNYFTEDGYTLTGGDTEDARVHYRLGSPSGVAYLTQTITITGYVTLDLNGLSLEPNTGVNVPIITVARGGHLTLTDSTSNTTYWKKNESGEWGTAGSGYQGTTIPTTGGWITGGKGLCTSGTYYGGGVYVESGGSLTMTGGNIINNTVGTGSSSGYGGGVYVESGGSFTMSGGTIFGNSAVSYGGGVYVNGTGTFTMSGDAKIWYNTSGGDGGGVYVYCDTPATDGSYNFTMNGGTISNNTGASYNSDSSGGGGVGVCGGSFKMTGGIISDNTAMPTATNNPLGKRYGGGVFVRYGGSFTMEGGTISGNSANGKQYSGYGGGVAVMDGTFQMSGTAAISGNSVSGTKNDGTTSTGLGGGVFIGTTYTNHTAEFTMSGGTIGGTTDSDENTASHGGGVCVENNSTFTMSGSAVIRGNKATGAGDTQGHGGGVMVGNTSNADTTQFTMSGGTISGNTASTNGGGVAVFYGTFTMSNGTISGNSAPRGGGVNLDNTGSTFTMSGGTIGGTNDAAKNTATFGGGGVYQNGGTFTMKGSAAIRGNKATDTGDTNGGGGVYVACGTFDMENGTIGGATGNTAKQGGGVYVGSRSSNTSLSGTFTMSGGSITGNYTSTNVASGGGGVYVDNGTFTMSGGTITGNNANTNGGGVYLCARTAAGTFNMSGGSIFGNKAGNYGGGVCMYGLNRAANFTVTGGSITGNNAGAGGGGGGVRVDADGDKGSTFTVSGNVTIKDNVKNGTLNDVTGKYTGSTADNVRLNAANDTITIGGALTGGNGSIGVSTYNELSESNPPIPFAVGKSSDPAYSLQDADKSAFFYDKNVPNYISLADNKLSLNYGAVALTGTVTISGTAKFEQQLTASVTGTNNTGTLSYQWKRGNDDISGANGENYTLTEADIGSTIQVVVTSSVQTGSIASSATGTVQKADGPAAPTGLTGVAPTAENGTDGKITGTGVTMEYKLHNSDSWSDCSADNTAVPAGTYDVRMKATSTHEAGTPAQVTVPAYTAPTTYGISLSQTGTYTFPAATVGYGDQAQWSVTVTNTGNQPTGELTVALSDAGANAFASVSSISSIAVNGDAVFAVKPVTGCSAGTYTATVTVSGGNSISASFTVSFTVNKITPQASDFAFTAPTDLIYNGSAKTAEVTSSKDGMGQITVKYFKGGLEVNEAKDAGEYTVRINVTEGGKYAAGTGLTDSAWKFTIAKATPTGAPTYTPITTSGKKLSDAALTANVSWPDGTVKWVNEGDQELPANTTDVTANTTYRWLFTPSDSTNYNSVEGTVTLWSDNPVYVPPTYRVESVAADDPNGSVRLSGSSAGWGDTVTITVTPNPNYRTVGVIVKDRNGNVLDVTKNADGTFSFRMPAGPVTVEPVFAWENPFEDVPENAYYTAAVEWALKNGIVEAGGTFGPNVSCTRAEMALLLWRAAGSPAPAGSDMPFTDVPEDADYAKAVRWAYENGFIGGTSAASFSPDAVCTRAQMATFLHRVAGLQKPAGSDNPFTDVPAAYYTEAVQWAYEQSIAGGTSATTFSPDKNCARGQMVTFLYRFFVK